MNLRNYQQDALGRSLDALQRGVNRQLVVMATGLGKAILFAALREHHRFRKKVMVLVHREELADQGADKISRWNPGLMIGVEMAQRWARPMDTFIVASVPTLGRRNSQRIERFDPSEFDAIVSDEAHHSVSPQWRRVLDYFGLMVPGSQTLSLGLTATPNRSDGAGLKDCFDEIVYDMGIRDGIESGFLCDLRGIRVGTDTDLDSVKTRAGDFAEDELADAVNNPKRNATIVKEWAKHALGRKTVAFTVNIQHALDLAEAFRSHGVRAEAIWGDDPDRKEKLRKHRHDFIEVLTNCAVLCLDLETEVLTDEGWTRWNEMTMAHKVANWQPDGSVFFEEPKEIIVRPLADIEHMVSVATERNNFRVTNTHRMIVAYGANRSGWKKIPAQALTNRHTLPACGVAEPLPTPQIEHSAAYSKRHVSANAYNLRRLTGMGIAASRAEAEKREQERCKLRRKHPSELTHDECRLIGFWIADGSRVAGKKRGGIEYVFTQSTVYPRIVAWFDGLIQRLGVHSVRRDKSHYPNPHIRWSLCRGTGGGSLRREGIFHLEPYLDKNGSDLLWGLNEQQFDALVEGYWYGDGKHGKAERGFPKNPYFADTKKSWIDLLCAIGSVRGWRCTVSHIKPRKKNHSAQWGLKMVKGGRISLSSATKIVHESYAPGLVWCVKTTSKNIITRRHGKVTVMGNTEGYDDPGITCIVMAKPTKSALLYTQMIGRGTRIDDGKTDCLLIDVVDNTRKHSLVTIPSLLGLPKDLDLKGKSVIKAKQEIERVAKEFPTANLQDIKNLDQLKSIAENVSLFQVSYPPEISRMTELTWRKAGEGYVLAVGRDLVSIGKDLRDEFQVRGKIGDQKIEMSSQNLPGAFNQADRAIMELGGEKRLLARDARWRSDSPTPAQIGLCGKLGLSIPAGATKGMVSAAIDAKLRERRMPNASLPKINSAGDGVLSNLQ